MHIVLTGGTGFIGSHIQKFLVSAGHQVTVYVRERSINKSNILSSCSIIEGSLTDSVKVQALVSECDLVLYCAGSVRGARLRDFSMANVLGVKVFAEAVAKSTGTSRRFVLMSSLAAERPYLSDYANTKYIGEKVLSGVDGLNWCIIRPPAVYGPGETELRPLFGLMRKGCAFITGPKRQRLSLLFVDDLARAVCTLVTVSTAFQHQTFTLHDGKSTGYSWDEIVKAVRPGRFTVKIRVSRFLLALLGKLNLWSASTFNYLPMLTLGKVRELSEDAWVCDNTKISGTCGWRPRVRLQEGIEKTFVEV